LISNIDEEANERQITGPELEGFLARNPQVKQLIENKAKECKNSTGKILDTTGRLGISTLASTENSDGSKQDDIFKAASEGNLENCQLFLAKTEDINVRDEDGQTALHWACDANHLEIVRFLLSNGADVNVQDKGMQTPLHFALISGHEDIAKNLIQAGANIDALDEDGNTPANLCDDNDILKRIGININTAGSKN